MFLSLGNERIVTETRTEVRFSLAQPLAALGKPARQRVKPLQQLVHSVQYAEPMPDITPELKRALSRKSFFFEIQKYGLIHLKITEI